QPGGSSETSTPRRGEVFRDEGAGEPLPGQGAGKLPSGEDAGGPLPGEGAGEPPLGERAGEPSHGEPGDERETPLEADEGAAEEPVRRVGRPPGGRPTRPDRLVASGPARPAGSGRHVRGPAPAALRRVTPVRGGRGRVAPMAVAVAIALLVTAGVVVWQWRAADESRLSLATGTGRSGDGLFTVPAAAQGTDQKLNDLAAVGRAVVAV